VSSYYRLFPFPVLLLLCGSILHGESARPLATTQSPHGSLNLPCITCHTTADWKVIQNKIKFNHAQTGFSLRGAPHDGVMSRLPRGSEIR